MKVFALWLCAGVGAILLASSLHAPSASAQPYKHAPAWTAPSKGPAAEHATLPLEEPPKIDPAAMPSTSLEPFLKTHLDTILAPLGKPAFVQTDLIEAVKEAYAGALPDAVDAHKPAYQLAMAVCDALNAAIEQRKQAVAALNAVYKRRLSEAIQPRGGKQAVTNSDKDEQFFYNSQKNNWLQNAAALRQQILALSGRQRAAETQAGDWTPPAPAVAEATPAPAVSVPPPEVDPVVGDWSWQNNGPLKLEADHSISGSRQGTWLYTSTTDAGRNYEMHWAHKDWVDYMVLTANGKMLDGKSKQGKHVFASR